MTVTRPLHRLAHPAWQALRDAGISVDEVAGFARASCGAVRAQLGGRSRVSEMVKLSVSELLDRDPIDLFFPETEPDRDPILPTAHVTVEYPHRKPEQITIVGERVAELLEWLDR